MPATILREGDHVGHPAFHIWCMQIDEILGVGTCRRTSPTLLDRLYRAGLEAPTAARELHPHAAHTGFTKIGGGKGGGWGGGGWGGGWGRRWGGWGGPGWWPTPYVEYVVPVEPPRPDGAALIAQATQGWQACGVTNVSFSGGAIYLASANPERTRACLPEHFLGTMPIYVVPAKAHAGAALPQCPAPFGRPPGSIGGSYDWWWCAIGKGAGFPYHPPSPNL